MEEKWETFKTHALELKLVQRSVSQEEPLETLLRRVRLTLHAPLWGCKVGKWGALQTHAPQINPVSSLDSLEELQEIFKTHVPHIMLVFTLGRYQEVQLEVSLHHAKPPMHAIKQERGRIPLVHPRI